MLSQMHVATLIASRIVSSHPDSSSRLVNHISYRMPSSHVAYRTSHVAIPRHMFVGRPNPSYMVSLHVAYASNDRI